MIFASNFASEITIFNLSIQFWVLGNYKSPSKCQKSNFGSVNNLLCKLPFQATIAAFLAFMAFKFKNIEISALLTPNEAKFTKK